MSTSKAEPITRSTAAVIEPTCLPGSMETNSDTVVVILEDFRASMVNLQCSTKFHTIILLAFNLEIYFQEVTDEIQMMLKSVTEDILNTYCAAFSSACVGDQARLILHNYPNNNYASV